MQPRYDTEDSIDEQDLSVLNFTENPWLKLPPAVPVQDMPNEFNLPIYLNSFSDRLIVKSTEPSSTMLKSNAPQKYSNLRIKISEELKPNTRLNYYPSGLYTLDQMSAWHLRDKTYDPPPAETDDILAKRKLKEIYTNILTSKVQYKKPKLSNYVISTSHALKLKEILQNVRIKATEIEVNFSGTNRPYDMKQKFDSILKNEVVLLRQMLNTYYCIYNKHFKQIINKLDNVSSNILANFAKKIIQPIDSEVIAVKLSCLYFIELLPFQQFAKFVSRIQLSSFDFVTEYLEHDKKFNYTKLLRGLLKKKEQYLQSHMQEKINHYSNTFMVNFPSIPFLQALWQQFHRIKSNKKLTLLEHRKTLKFSTLFFKNMWSRILQEIIVTAKVGILSREQKEYRSHMLFDYLFVFSTNFMFVAKSIYQLSFTLFVTCVNNICNLYTKAFSFLINRNSTELQFFNTEVEKAKSLIKNQDYEQKISRIPSLDEFLFRVNEIDIKRLSRKSLDKEQYFDFEQVCCHKIRDIKILLNRLDKLLVEAYLQYQRINNYFLQNQPSVEYVKSSAFGNFSNRVYLIRMSKQRISKLQTLISYFDGTLKHSISARKQYHNN